MADGVTSMVKSVSSDWGVRAMTLIVLGLLVLAGLARPADVGTAAQSTATFTATRTATSTSSATSTKSSTATATAVGAGNPIVAENQQAGTGQWQIPNDKGIAV